MIKKMTLLLVFGCVILVSAQKIDTIIDDFTGHPYYKVGVLPADGITMLSCQQGGEMKMQFSLPWSAEALAAEFVEIRFANGKQLKIPVDYTREGAYSGVLGADAILVNITIPITEELQNELSTSTIEMYQAHYSQKLNKRWGDKIKDGFKTLVQFANEQPKTPREIVIDTEIDAFSGDTIHSYSNKASNKLNFVTLTTKPQLSGTLIQFGLIVENNSSPSYIEIKFENGTIVKGEIYKTCSYEEQSKTITEYHVIARFGSELDTLLRQSPISMIRVSEETRSWHSNIASEVKDAYNKLVQMTGKYKEEKMK